MPDFNAQNTDAENSRPCHTATKPGDDLKSTNLGSVQKVAQSRKNLGGLEGGTGDAVTAPMPGGDL